MMKYVWVDTDIREEDQEKRKIGDGKVYIGGKQCKTLVAKSQYVRSTCGRGQPKSSNSLGWRAAARERWRLLRWSNHDDPGLSSRCRA
jgi:hypothetical protein